MKRFLIGLLISAVCMFGQGLQQTKPRSGAQVDWGNPINRRLVGWWLFNGGAGLRFNDIAGGFEGTRFIVGGDISDWIGSPFGGAFSFDTNDYITVSNRFPALANGDSISVSAWVNPRTAADQRVLFGFGAGGDNPIMEAILTSTNAISGFIETDTSDQKNLSTDGTQLVANEWSHVVVVFDRNTNQAIRYLNGKQTGTIDDISAQTGKISTLDATQIGALAGGTTLNGNLEDLFVCHRALTAKEVQQLFHSPYGGILRTIERLTRWFVEPPVGGARRLIFIR